MRIKLAIAFIVTILSTLSINAQYCGGSTRYIRLEYPGGVAPAEKVAYELFYVMPKQKTDKEFEEKSRIVSELVYGKAFSDRGGFWRVPGGANSFLIPPHKRAEKYISAYRLEDFAYIYNDEFFYGKFHPQQLKGEAKFGEIELKTRETDDTPFLMRVTAQGFETRYYVTNFLGGCHHRTGENAPKILMKKQKAN